MTQSVVEWSRGVSKFCVGFLTGRCDGFCAFAYELELCLRQTVGIKRVYPCLAMAQLSYDLFWGDFLSKIINVLIS